MPFAMVFIGLLMVISGMRDTHADLGNELVSDIGGKGGFGTRLLAIGAVGAVGYMGGEWRRLSVYFMVLVLIALMFSADKGFFAQLTSARKAGPAAVTASPASTSVATTQSAQASTVPMGAAQAAPVNATSAGAPSPKSKAMDFLGTYGKYLMFLL